MPIVMCCCETWATTKGDKKKLLTFKRKALRKIYGLWPYLYYTRRRGNMKGEQM